MKIGYYLCITSKMGTKLGKKSDMGRQVGLKWPQKIGYHMWMTPNSYLDVYDKIFQRENEIDSSKFSKQRALDR